MFHRIGTIGLKVVTPQRWGNWLFVGLPSAELNLFMTLFDTDGSSVLSLWEKWGIWRKMTRSFITA